MKSIYRKNMLRAFFAAIIVLGFLGIGKATDTPVQATSEVKTLNVVTTPSEYSYYNSKNGADGIEFHLIDTFAYQFDYNLNIILADNQKEVFQALETGIADIALVGKPLSLSRQADWPQSPSYMDVTSQLIYKHGEGRPHAFEDLADKTIFVQDTEQNREKYDYIRSHYGDIDWQFTDYSVEELLGMVNTGTIDYTVVDSHQYLVKRPLFTRTRVAFDLYYPEPISFALAQETTEDLQNSLNVFFDRAREDGTIERLLERFYGHADDINPRGSMTFFKRVRTRLPHYHDLIEQVAKEYDMDWRLLAAVSYQESHWNPHARSHTGVRGMMMLTQGTASDMGIENRLDVTQSLRGGAKYFKSLYKRVPDSIREPDRTWFTLAAYNVGLGHILDARKIAEFHDGNPDSWADVKKYLPLLEREEWYAYTRYGFARGNEPVKYVQNIRHFNDLLEWRFPPQQVKGNVSPTHISVKELDEAIRDAKSEEPKRKTAALEIKRLFL